MKNIGKIRKNKTQEKSRKNYGKKHEKKKSICISWPDPG